MVTVVRWLVVVLMVVHGLLHLLGAAKGLGWAEVQQLKEPIGVAAGVGWLFAALLVLTTAAMIAARTPTWWWIVAGSAAVTSELLITTNWSDAWAGTLPNIVLVLAAVLGFASVGPTSYHAEYDRRAREALAAAPAPGALVTEEDLAGLPEPVARYVRRSGAVGKAAVTGFSARVSGRIRNGPHDPWMPFTGRQVDVFGPQPQRLFYIDATRAGLPVTVFHDYDAGTASMRGRLLGLFRVVDASGPAMNKGETVTVLNDLVVFAPAALIGAPIKWTVVDANHVRATYTVGTQVVDAELVFNKEGDLVGFVSDDRLRASADGKSFQPMRWHTPLNSYRDVGDRRVATGGEGRWYAPAPDGHYTYVTFSVDDITYNPQQNQAVSAPPSGSSAIDPVSVSGRNAQGGQR